MTNSEADYYEESLEELIGGVSSVGLRYYSGGRLGNEFTSLDGLHIKRVREIIEKFGQAGRDALNTKLGPIIEADTQLQIETLDKIFREEMLPHVHGAPYLPHETEYLRLKEEGVPNLITTLDYDAIEAPKAAFSRFLNAYRRGEPVEVYIGVQPQEVTGVYGNKGTFPETELESRKITFKKPTVNARTGIS